MFKSSTLTKHEPTPGRRQSKTPILSKNVDQKSRKTVFSIAICCHTGDKWELKTLFLWIFDPRSPIVDKVFDCRLPGVEPLEQDNGQESWKKEVT